MPRASDFFRTNKKIQNLFFGFLLFFSAAAVLLITTPVAVSLAGTCRPTEVDTGIGCIPYQPEPFAKRIVQIIAGFAGGIALLLLLVGGVQFVTSSGDPDSLDEAKTKITAALSGLFFILFSVMVLRIIGVDILGLPGFNPLGGGGVQVPGP